MEHFETERRRSDGRRILVSLTISPIKDDAGNVVGASKIVRDVTQQREAEQREQRLRDEAAAERQKFVTLIENSTDFIGICDLDGVPLLRQSGGTRAGRPREHGRGAPRACARLLLPRRPITDHGRVLSRP